MVVTGASSGIGRETSLQLADAGAHLVLAARDALALEEVARECRERGVEAMAVPTDVSDEGRVEALREATMTRFGGIDVWVNDAGAYMLGPVDEVPSAGYRRLFDVNVMGVVHGTKAALRAMKPRGRGVIINVGAIAGKMAYAQAAAYCASKHAVHAFTEALRQELVGTGIEACIVVPASVDTPIYQHAANYSGRPVEAMHPVYPAEQVAAAIVDCARSPRREVMVGAVPHLLAATHTVMPRLVEQLMPRLVEREHMGAGGQARSSGNLFSAKYPHRIDGGWRERKPPVGARPLVGIAALGSLLALGAYAFAVRQMA